MEPTVALQSIGMNLSSNEGSFIFTKDFENIEGSLYRIAENENDLSNLNISQSDYKIIEDSQSKTVWRIIKD